MLSLVSVGIIAGFLYYLYANADKYRQLLHISLLDVLALLALTLAFPVINGLINTYMFRNMGANLSHSEGIYLAAAATLANQLPLPGAIVARGIYLKRQHGLSYTGYFSSQLALFVCTMAIDGFIGLAILLDWLVLKSTVVSPVLLLAFGGMAACLLIFWLPWGRIPVPATLRKWTDQALEGWMLFRRDPLLLTKLLVLEVVEIFLLAMRYWLAFHMLSQNVSWGQVLLFASASILTQLISFAPGGLGVRELIVGAIAVTLGFDLPVSMAAVGLDRLVMTLTIVVVGWISTIILGKKISDAPLKPDEQNA